MKIHFRLLPFFCVFCAVGGHFLRGMEIPATTAEGYSVPQPRPTFAFPRDHGAHPDFKIEWWYITGHLFTSDSSPRRFGFQATFFRNASPRDLPAAHSSAAGGAAAFGHDQIYLAHMALIDVGAGRFLHQERLNRAGWNASAATNTLDVVNGDWSLAFASAGEPESSTQKPSSQSLIDNIVFHRLPTWTELAAVSESELRACSLGFRARHVAAIARFLAENPGWLEATEHAPYSEAKASLITLQGVGEKVADCVLLFGAGRLEAFPVDTWILKALARRYDLAGWKPAQVAHFGRTHFGPQAGLAQQYLFAYERAAARGKLTSP
jgi:hypothetical protein